MLQIALRILFLTAMSVAACGITVVLGAAPLASLRNTEGRLAFILAVTVASTLLLITKSYPLLIPFILSAVLVFVFLEALEHSASLLRAGIMAVSLSFGLSLVGFSLYAKSLGLTVPSALQAQLEGLVKALPTLPEGVVLDVGHLVQQSPSAIVILMALSLWLAALFGQRFAPGDEKTVLGQTVLRDFDLPDIFVWALILSMPGSFLAQHHTVSYMVSVNVFNVLVFLYFLKGLSIVATYFYVGKVGPIWRTIWYALLISQLFLLVAVIGLLDVWMSLRNRITKKSAEPIKR